MRISELSRHSGISISSIKFYIREGVLPAGERSQRNQAQYSEDHLRRLDLIKALREVAGLPLDTVRAVLEQADKPFGDGDPIGTANAVIYPVPERDRTESEKEEYDTTRGEVETLMLGLPWALDDEMGVRVLNIDLIADAITQMRKYIDPQFPVDQIAGLAALAWHESEIVFENDEDRVPRPGDDLVDPVRTAILGTLLHEQLSNAIARAAFASRSLHISLGLNPPPVK
jgi:DNA-binding transcriptional MerR regulator